MIWETGLRVRTQRVSGRRTLSRAFRKHWPSIRRVVDERSSCRTRERCMVSLWTWKKRENHDTAATTASTKSQAHVCCCLFSRLPFPRLVTRRLVVRAFALSPQTLRWRWRSTLKLSLKLESLRSLTLREQVLLRALAPCLRLRSSLFFLSPLSPQSSSSSSSVGVSRE